MLVIFNYFLKKKCKKKKSEKYIHVLLIMRNLRKPQIFRISYCCDHEIDFCHMGSAGYLLLVRDVKEVNILSWKTSFKKT